MLNRHLSKYPLMLIALMVFLFAASEKAIGKRHDHHKPYRWTERGIQ